MKNDITRAAFSDALQALINKEKGELPKRQVLRDFCPHRYRVHTRDGWRYDHGE